MCSQQPLQCGNEILIASWTDSRVPPSAVSILSRVSFGWKLARVFFSFAAMATTAFYLLRSLSNPMCVMSASSLCSPDHVGLRLRSCEAHSTQYRRLGEKLAQKWEASNWTNGSFRSCVRAGETKLRQFLSASSGHILGKMIRSVLRPAVRRGMCRDYLATDLQLSRGRCRIKSEDRCTDE